jgi:hypothetical protein
VRDVTAIFHRSKEVNVYPLEGDRFLIRDHDVRAEVEIPHPALTTVAARSEVRNGPFTAVCDLARPNMDRRVGMTVARGFTQQARAVVGPGGGHRVSAALSGARHVAQSFAKTASALDALRPGPGSSISDSTRPSRTIMA